MNWFSTFLSSGPASGNWRGHYVQQGLHFPIEATLKHRRSRLIGSMTDLKCYRSQPLNDMLRELAMPRKQIESFVAEVRSQFPGSPSGEIEYRSTLPSASTLDGKINGLNVSFTKCYEGFIDCEYVLNGLALPDPTACELVQYTGRMTEDYGTISGCWIINPTHDHETTITGRFELKRQISVRD